MMINRRFNLILYIILILFNVPGNAQQTKNRFQVDQTLKSGTYFYVEDSSLYATEFLTDLRDLAFIFKYVKIIGPNFLTNQGTFSIPTYLPLNKMITYKAQLKSRIYKLILKRINYTNVEYEFIAGENFNKKGVAILSPGYVFGCEFAETDSNELFQVYQYFDNSYSQTCIQIENETGNKALMYLKSLNDTIPILKRE